MQLILNSVSCVVTGCHPHLHRAAFVNTNFIQYHSAHSLNLLPQLPYIFFQLNNLHYYHLQTLLSVYPMFLINELNINHNLVKLQQWYKLVFSHILMFLQMITLRNASHPVPNFQFFQLLAVFLKKSIAFWMSLEYFVGEESYNINALILPKKSTS